METKARLSLSDAFLLPPFSPLSPSIYTHHLLLLLAHEGAIKPCTLKVVVHAIHLNLMPTAFIHYFTPNSRVWSLEFFAGC